MHNERSHRDAILPPELVNAAGSLAWPDEGESEPESESPRMYLRGEANATDWQSARRVVEKSEDMLGGLSEDEEKQLVRLIVRAVAKARTRGQRDVLRALGHDTKHLYEEGKPCPR
jgi:hypothetical protein